MTEASDHPLVQRLIDLVAVDSVTGNEAEIADLIEKQAAQAGVASRRVGNSVVVGDLTAPPAALLVGHLDTVPHAVDTDTVARIETHDGEPWLVGRGTVDMKGGDAIIADLIFERQLPGVVGLLYAGEEGGEDDNELVSVLDELPVLTESAIAVVCEPTGGRVELGCQGSVHATVTFHGEPAHAARAFLGTNAIGLATGFLRHFAEPDTIDVEIDGLGYRDITSVVGANTFNAHNVVPDRFVIGVNRRFAPTRGVAAASEELRTDLVSLAPDATIEIGEGLPAADPNRTLPAVAQFISHVGVDVAPKHGWTDVARFTERGIAALNYGPGDPLWAHRVGERVAIADLLDCHTRLLSYCESLARD